MSYDYYPYKPKFSDDIALPYHGGSTTYIMLQTAVNMGFNEIYLIGMDNKVPIIVTHDGEIILNAEIKQHFYDNEKVPTVCYTKDMFEAAFVYARKHCNNMGVKIYNATRGGHLESFERVDFSSLF